MSTSSESLIALEQVADRHKEKVKDHRNGDRNHQKGRAGLPYK
ncbi:unnamed protein product [Ectocarpus sp. CCAP 1310/34]|nr:unnamed protein product [Ectocarpus sp. CCAP 1310/34]